MNMERMLFQEEIPVRERSYDVIVAGAGVAGLAAALTARRAGKSVLLIEKSTMLGGLATLGLINLFVPMCNGRGKQIIFGLAEEFLRFSIRYGWAKIPAEWRNGQPETPTEVRYIARYSPNIFAIALTEFFAVEGVDLLFDVICSAPVMEEKHCKGVIIQGKSGREFIKGSIIIDATGDADLLRRAGVPMFKRGNFTTYAVKAISLESCRKAVESGRIEDAIWGHCGYGVNLYGKGQPENIPLCDGTDTDQVSRFLEINQRKLFERIKEDDPESREIVTLPGMAQLRTSCCIEGDYVLQESDTYRHFEDSIGAICDFERRDYLYEMPYRILIRSGYDNLITAGRCAAGEGYAWDVIRVIPPAIITGQAAGNAAVVALDTNCGIDKVDVAKVQQKQAEQNGMLHFDDSLVPRDAASAGETGEEIGHI